MKLAVDRHRQEELAKAAAQNAIEKLEWEKQRRLQTEIEATQQAVKEKARREREEIERLAKVEADRTRTETPTLT
jgi:hypothetical protein